MKIGTPKNWGPENSDSSALGQLLRENEKDYGKTKPIGITTISRLSSHQVWLDLAQGHPSYMGLISCVFWPVAHGAVLQSHMEWKGMALSSSKCRRIIQTDGFLDCDAHARFGFYYIFYFAWFVPIIWVLSILLVVQRSHYTLRITATMLTGSQLYELPAADGWMALEEFSQCEMLQQLQRPHDVTEQSGQTDNRNTTVEGQKSWPFFDKSDPLIEQTSVCYCLMRYCQYFYVVRSLIGDVG